MLQTLSIENVALIDKAVLDLQNGLNVISGETGAGKSILLDSLSFVFGGRADKSLIRTGTDKMKVEAIFSALNDATIEYIKNELNIDCSEEMFLSRELDLQGKNTCKINGEIVPVAVIKKICSKLVDIHGQSEHLAILDNAYQLEIIDLFSKTAEAKLLELSSLIEQDKDILRQIADLGGSEKEKQSLIDLYTYQINEIEQAKISATEFDDLSNEKKAMQQYEKINDNLRQAYSANAKNEYGDSAVEKLSEAKKCLEGLSQFGDSYTELAERIKSTLIELEDINQTILDKLESNIFDQDRFNYLDERLDYIKSLFRKYGGDYVSMQQYYQEISTKLSNLINGAERYTQLNDYRKTLLKKIDQVQNELTEIRKKSAKELSQKIQEELHTLGMPNAKLEVEFFTIDEQYSLTGKDRVEFMFSANLGFETKELKKVVSGGEMSRVMLAHKIVTANVDSIGTIIFDEIDTGLSGNIAMVVAEYMARLSKQKQILAVSHLPQICAMADNNLKVEKSSSLTTTSTKITTLDLVGALKEIARLMGAVGETELQTSQALKNKCNDYKLKLQ